MRTRMWNVEANEQPRGRGEQKKKRLATRNVFVGLLQFERKKTEPQITLLSIWRME